MNKNKGRDINLSLLLFPYIKNKIKI